MRESKTMNPQWPEGLGECEVPAWLPEYHRVGDSCVPLPSPPSPTLWLV